MPVRFNCHCGKRVTAPDESAGREGTCPTCRALIVVPAVGEENRMSAVTPRVLPLSEIEPHVTPYDFNKYIQPLFPAGFPLAFESVQRLRDAGWTAEDLLTTLLPDAKQQRVALYYLKHCLAPLVRMLREAELEEEAKRVETLRIRSLEDDTVFQTLGSVRTAAEHNIQKRLGRVPGAKLELERVKQAHEVEQAVREVMGILRFDKSGFTSAEVSYLRVWKARTHADPVPPAERKTPQDSWKASVYSLLNLF